MFKKGDFVRLKGKMEIETGELVDNWGGRVHSVYREERVVDVALDAITIRSFSDQYILMALEQGLETVEYMFPVSDVELCESRSTDEEIMAAIDELVAREIALEEEVLAKKITLDQQTVTDFKESTNFHQLDTYSREKTDFILGSFLELLRRHEEVHLRKWSSENIQFACLELVPSEVVAGEEVFSVYGDVLLAFFHFLDQEKRLDNGRSIIRVVEKIKPKIAKKAMDADNWSQTKALTFEAATEGVDIDDKEVLTRYIEAKRHDLMFSRSRSAKKIRRPISADLYKEIGRNQKITVKYPDGKIMENIKFKKVEKDLRNGDCALIKK